VQVRCAPTLAPIHVAEDVRVRLSEPSPRLYASTVCVVPFAPCAIETGPTVDAESRNLGDAARRPGKRKTAVRNRRLVRPTREHPFYKPRYSPLPGSPETPPPPQRRTSSTGGTAPP